MQSDSIDRVEIRKNQIEYGLIERKAEILKVEERIFQEKKLYQKVNESFCEIRKRLLDTGRVAKRNIQECTHQSRVLAGKLSEHHNNLRTLNSRLEGLKKQSNGLKQTVGTDLKKIELLKQMITKHKIQVALKKDGRASEDLIDLAVSKKISSENTLNSDDYAKAEQLNSVNVYEDRIILEQSLQRLNDLGAPAVLTQTNASDILKDGTADYSSRGYALEHSPDNKQSFSHEQAIDQCSVANDIDRNAEFHSKIKSLKSWKSDSAQSMELTYYNQQGSRFHVQVNLREDGVLNVAIVTEKPRDRSALLAAKQEIVRSLRSSGIQISNIVVNTTGAPHA